jgi:toxin ParE1/3/4
MKFKLQILEVALRDMDEIALFIAQDDVEAAYRFLSAVAETFKEIESDPTAWPGYEIRAEGFANLRKRSVKSFRNHLVFYRITDKRIEVIRVLHGARDIPRALRDL